MSSLHVKLLGGFELHDGSGAPVGPLRRQAQAMLSVLALSPGVALSRDKLAALLWSDRSDSQARGGLRHVLSDLRKALVDFDPPPLIADRESARIDSNAVEVDAITFARLIDDGTPESLERAAALYQGEFLDGLGVHDAVFEEWVRDERARLHDCARAGVSRLLEHRMAAGETDDALATAKRLLGLDPLHEGAHRALMRIHAANGDRTLALKQYQTCCDVLQSELGLDPEVETQELNETIRQEDQADRRVDAPAEAEPKEALPLPEKPSIAVLPFANMSGDPEQEYFSDGITEDIVTSLSKFENLFIVACNSTFAYKGQAIDVRRVGREQGVRYVLEGSVRRSGDRLRITSQLIDAATGKHLWAERYDRTLEDVFVLQDEITREVITAIQVKLLDGEQARPTAAGTQNFNAWELTVKAGTLLENNVREDNQKARELFEEAAQLDPSYATAWCGLGWVTWQAVRHQWSASPKESLAKAWEMAGQARDLDPDSAEPFALFATIALQQGDYPAAETFAERTLERAGSGAGVIVEASRVLSCCGRASDAIGHVERAMRLCPLYANYYRVVLGRACLLAGDLKRAIAVLREWQHYETEPVEPVLLATALYDDGQRDEAKALLREAVEAKPTFAISKWAGKQTFSNPEVLAHMVAVLEKFGVPK